MRRYSGLKPSRGTVIPHEVRLAVLNRDAGCIGFRLLEGECQGPLELDHVRASHGMGLKSESTPDNLVALCGAHHRMKTEHGRQIRPILVAYLERVSA